MSVLSLCFSHRFGEFTEAQWNDFCGRVDSLKNTVAMFYAPQNRKGDKDGKESKDDDERTAEVS